MKLIGTKTHSPGGANARRVKAGGIGIVSAVAELAAQIEEMRAAPQAVPADVAELVRAVYVFLQALLPDASREARQAVAELVVLELLRSRVESANKDACDTPETCGSDQDRDGRESRGARILEVPAAAERL